MSGLSKHKKFSLVPASEPNSNINITPLVDVVLVMLIIFMVVTPLLEKDIAVRMPATEEVIDQSDIPPDQLVVKVQANGDLEINSEKVPRGEYVDRLSTILKRKKPADKIVFVVADDGAKYGFLVSALDGAKQAGAETLGMATDVPSAAPDAPPAPPTPPTPPPTP
jgi:biopolymer transport protein TolR